MKTIKCIKDTIGFREGEIYETDESSYFLLNGSGLVRWDNFPEYFQEVEEEPVKKPKWKVGDKVVRIFSGTMYTKITAIETDMEDFWYYVYGNNVGYITGDLRDPTPEELSTYFN